MAGVFQTLFQRAFSAGLYFPLEEVFDVVLRDRLLHVDTYDRKSMFLSGLLAGAVNGIAMNPFSAVKYHYWGRSEREIPGTFVTTATHMLKRGGIRPFLLGSLATIQRDIVFGAFYAILRHELTAEHSKFKSLELNSFVANVIAASTATLVSSPFNYVRNMHYATPAGRKHASSTEVLRDLWLTAMKEENLYKRLKYLQHRLRIGWGTARVGCGMAFSAKLYELCSRHVNYR